MSEPLCEKCNWNAQHREAIMRRICGKSRTRTARDLVEALEAAVTTLDKLMPLPDPPEGADMSNKTLKDYAKHRQNEMEGMPVPPPSATQAQRRSGKSKLHGRPLDDDGAIELRTALTQIREERSEQHDRINSLSAALDEERAERARLQEEIENLLHWRAQVAVSFGHEGGTFYADVPKHIRDLRAENARLQEEREKFSQAHAWELERLAARLRVEEIGHQDFPLLQAVEAALAALVTEEGPKRKIRDTKIGLSENLIVCPNDPPKESR